MRNKTLLLHDASFISIRHSDYLYYDFITFVCLWLRVWSDNWILAVRLNVTFMPVAFRQMQLEKMAFRQVRLEEILPQRSRTQCCEFRCTLLLHAQYVRSFLCYPCRLPPHPHMSGIVSQTFQISDACLRYIAYSLATMPLTHTLTCKVGKLFLLVLGSQRAARRICTVALWAGSRVETAPSLTASQLDRMPYMALYAIIWPK